MARKASILRPALRDYGGQVVHSDISSSIKRGGLWRDPFESRPIHFTLSFLLPLLFWKHPFGRKFSSKREFSHRVTKGRRSSPSSWKIGAVIAAKHACFELVIEEGSTNGVEILYLFMICIWKVVEVEQEKSEPGPNSIRLSKDKPFYFSLTTNTRESLLR